MDTQQTTVVDKSQAATDRTRRNLKRQRSQTDGTESCAKKSNREISNEQTYKDLKDKLYYRRRENITLLFHATSERKKTSIMKGKTLKGNSTAAPHGSPLAENSDINGVWFSGMLFQGKLPTISPFGTERIKIPITALIETEKVDKWQLFFESTYYYKDDVQYVRLVLGNKDDSSTSESLQWCEKNLHEISLTDNPLLCWDDGYMEVITYEPDHVSVYVEVLVLGDLDLDKLDEIKWDRVGWTARATNSPTLGLSYRLKFIDQVYF